MRDAQPSVAFGILVIHDTPSLVLGSGLSVSSQSVRSISALWSMSVPGGRTLALVTAAGSNVRALDSRLGRSDSILE